MHLPKINFISNLLILNLILLLSFQVNAASYNFIDLGTSGTGNQSGASAINNSGQIVGWSSINDYSYSYLNNRATLWSGATITDLGALGDESKYNPLSYSMANDINDSGQIVGQSYSSGGSQSHATLWNGSTITDLGTLGGNFSYAYAINNSGQIVGTSEVVANTGDKNATLWDSNGITNLSSLDNSLNEAFAINNSGQIISSTDTTDFRNLLAKLLNGTSVTDLIPLDGTASVANSINDSGQIVGSSINLNGDSFIVHATLWDGIEITNLGTLSGEFPNSIPMEINTIGQIVGVSYSPLSQEYASRATLWDGASAIDLNTLLDEKTIADGWVLNNAHDINDNGWIVGTASNPTLGLESRAFLLTPVPEAETYALLLAGLSIIALSLNRKFKINKQGGH
ncbi:MAG: DUF3466 family protein [Methylophilus sp.]